MVPNGQVIMYLKYNIMDIEKIKQLESENKGKTVHLYYDEMAGLYLAFGMSAFCTTVVLNPFISYSESLQMPVALINPSQILFLRQGLTKEEFIPKSYYRFSLRQSISDFGYSKWAEEARAAHERNS